MKHWKKPLELDMHTEQPDSFEALRRLLNSSEAEHLQWLEMSPNLWPHLTLAVPRMTSDEASDRDAFTERVKKIWAGP